MALADSLNDVVNAVGDIVASLGDTTTSQLKTGWAKVATAFFSAGTNPSWTPEALEIGEAAFSNTFVIPEVLDLGAPDRAQVSLASGFAAYAAVSEVVGLCVPLAPNIPPITKPIGNPDFSAIISMGLPPSGTHLEGATLIHSKLLLWAATGTVTVPPPAGGVLPWV